MFKIDSLNLYNNHNEVFSYQFEPGINYFIGKNNSGKTEFYKFIDYMFGSSVVIKNSIWFKGTLDRASMFFTYNGIAYRVSRVLSTDKCYFSYADELDKEPIEINEYRDRLHAVFSVNKIAENNLYKFTDEHLTFRTFTLFNFLGEIRQGVLVDFFDKCSDIKYSTKISAIINYIFNKNVEKIFYLKNEIARLQNEINQKKYVDEQNKYLLNKVNINLKKLNIKEMFNGHNRDVVLEQLNNMVNFIESNKPLESKNISDLEIICSNIDEQIKVYEKYKSDLRQQQHENINRGYILSAFKSIISKQPNFEYLVAPLISLTNEIDNSISFSQHVLKDDLLLKLRAQKKQVLDELTKAQMQLTRFSYDEKNKAIAIAEDGINSYSISCTKKELDSLLKKLAVCKKELKDLQESDDTEKIDYISNQLTALYKSAYEVSDFVKDDFDKTNNSFHIRYIKGRNSLQTMTYDEKGNEIVYGMGSHARHTLIQLCGYLVFINLLIEEQKYPIIPILVIDHISKPFSDQNIAAIGTIIHKAYEGIGVDNLQTFIFDDESSAKLCLDCNHSENLVNEIKTGFNPFYSSNSN